MTWEINARQNFPWVISLAERQQNDTLFDTLDANNGLISGDKARTVFMKSGLSQSVLAQIWQLADVTKDGKMDKVEFSIAMHLIRAVLGGRPVPAVLPDSLKRSAMSFGGTNMPLPATLSMIGSSASVSPVPISIPLKPTMAQSVGKIKSDWSIPQNERLKYCQKFSQLDKGRHGYLMGVHAKNVLAQSQLPTVTLAEIWNLSDVNKDGRLNVDEFCIAMHLIDAIKEGFLLPKVLPPVLVPNYARPKNESPAPVPGEPPAQKVPLPKTFEDKRRDNYDRGQIELDRRRQILKEEEERRRMEIEKKEREEAAQRQKEKEELERRRRAEKAAELAKEKEKLASEMEEQRRILMAKESAKKEIEKQRRAELDAMRIREAKTRKQEEQENTVQRRQTKKTLSFQLQALDEKRDELNKKVDKSRDGIVSITSEIEQMRNNRDMKVARIEELQRDNQKLTVECEKLAHESLQMQSDLRSNMGAAQELQETRKRIDKLKCDIKLACGEIQSVQERTRMVQQLSDKKRNEMAELESLLDSAASNYSKVQAALKEKRALAVKEIESYVSSKAAVTPKMRNQMQSESSANAKNGVDSSPVAHEAASVKREVSPVTSNNTQLPTSGPGITAVKYRALYEFVARTDDELSFQPGDIILVFERHAAEPGWLAGQIRDKVGWFPQAFAAPLNVPNVQSSTSLGGPVMSPSSEPLHSIAEEPPMVKKSASQQSTKEDQTSAGNDIQPDSSVSTENVIGTGIAQYQWRARDGSELSFMKGERIEIIEQLEMRWRGRNSEGDIGWFPKSYVKMIEDQAVNGSGANSLKSLNSAKPQVDESSNKNAAITEDIISPQQSTIPQYDAVSVEPREMNPYGEWYVALYDFVPSEPNDLPLKAGDRILVTESVNDWWKGTCDGKSGIFPANYVQKDPSVLSSSANEVPDLGSGRALAAFEATADNQLSLRVGDIVKVRIKSSAGWWQGEMANGKGEKKIGWFPGNYIEMIEDGKPLLAEAMFDYTAQRDDELTFKRGAVIIVNDRSNREWWKGRLESTATGSEALFPANYVRLR